MNRDVYKKLLIDNNFSTNEDIIGVEQSEISFLENELKFNLPFVYKEFLLACGKRAGMLASTLGFYYPDIVGLHKK